MITGFYCQNDNADAVKYEPQQLLQVLNPQSEQE
jgi:hypothetical protein